MPIGSILLGLALAILVLPFVISPLTKSNRRKQEFQAERDRSAPELAKQDALIALRDLDFDFRTGKIAEEDYTPLRQRLVAEAAQALQAAGAPQPDWDAEIEVAVRAVRARRRSSETLTCFHCQASVAVGSKFCPQCGAALEIVCPQCHSPIHAGDKFCALCGALLKLEAAPVS